MKKNIKLLISSAFVTLAFSILQSAPCMEDSSKHQDRSAGTPRSYQTGPTVNNSLHDFLQDSSFYHQVATEKYRKSVQSLRQETLNLQQNAVSAGTVSESKVVQAEIDHLTTTLSLQKEVFQKYGTDQETVKEQITGEIRELEESKKASLKKINEKPLMKGLYEAQIKDTERCLETCNKYLASLSKSETMLKSELESTQKYLKTVNQKTNLAIYVKETVARKINEINALYESHVNGVLDVFPHNLPRVILEGIGVSLTQLNHVQTDRMFQVFARTLELPYIFVQTGGEKEEAYLKQLKVLKQNLTNRLQEDIFCLQLGISMAQNKKPSFDFKVYDTMVEKLLTNSEAIKATLNKNRDLETLKGILLSYGGYGENNPSQFLETLLNESSYGLLGLYVSSLEFSPVSSWSNPNLISCHARLKDAKSPEVFSGYILETILSILGRHINNHVLTYIDEKLQKNREKSLMPDVIEDDIFI